MYCTQSYRMMFYLPLHEVKFLFSAPLMMVPSGQNKHVNFPASGWYVPEGHFSHFLVSMFLKVPGPHWAVRNVQKVLTTYVLIFHRRNKFMKVHGKSLWTTLWRSFLLNVFLLQKYVSFSPNSYEETFEKCGLHIEKKTHRCLERLQTWA